MQRKGKWYQGKQAKLFQLVLSPFYMMFEFVFKRKIITITCPSIDRTAENLWHYRNTYDYVRMRTLGLIAAEINAQNIIGDVAEVGVFRGDFAERINREFRDRKLYLYDTFDGFVQEQEQFDLNNDFVGHKNLNDFKDTNVDIVISRMTYPDKCIIRAGQFPHSAEEEYGNSFVFVSIDVDLYKPTYDALCFFYPRLVDGGYLFIHDYNSNEYLGVMEAVKKFEQENGRLSKVPIPDCSGTLVIIKASK